MSYPNLRAEMEKHGVAIQELAGYMELSADTIQLKIEGKKEFTLAEIEKLANIFECSLDYLVGHVTVWA